MSICSHLFICFFQIGLMRGGKFLAEESPDNLLRKFQCETLEDVFLKLSVMQNMGKRRRSSIVQEVTEQVVVPGVSVGFDICFYVIFKKTEYFSMTCDVECRIQRWISPTRTEMKFLVNLVIIR